MFAITNRRLRFIVKRFIRILIGKLLSIKYKVAIFKMLNATYEFERRLLLSWDTLQHYVSSI